MISPEPIFVMIMMEALSPEFKKHPISELLYAGDLTMLAESVEESMEKVMHWKAAWEAEGLEVNIGKTKLSGWSHNC